MTQHLGVPFIFTDTRELSLWLLHQLSLHKSCTAHLRFEYAGVVQVLVSGLGMHLLFHFCHPDLESL